MPQMAPLPWTFIFILTITSLLALSANIYFLLKTPTPGSNSLPKILLTKILW